MPIFEYKCITCKKVVDKVQKLGTISSTICPVCGTPTLVKLFSVPYFCLNENNINKSGTLT
jgi:putative FmdB family regulatory protein